MDRQLLVIDDDPAIQHLVRAHLANSRTECIAALDGAAGVWAAIEYKPSAILLDMNMPGMDGMETCNRLKANPQTREIPIVFLTSDRSASSKVKGIEMGAVDYVTKPFNPLELRARVHSVFRTIHTLESAHALVGVDQSTGLWNRAFLFKQIEVAVATAARARQMVSCLFLSIDRFDELARKTGQPGGEDLIREAAELMSTAIRPDDLLCRYDERILAAVSLVPDYATCRLLAHRLRSQVAEIGLRSFMEPEQVTCSVGLVAARASVGPAILQAATQALALAQVGGNCIATINTDAIQTASDAQPAN